MPPRRLIVKSLSVYKDIAEETGSRFVPQNNSTVKLDTKPTRCHVWPKKGNGLKQDKLLREARYSLVSAISIKVQQLKV